MADLGAKLSTWEEIERSESYLVCCMFEEAVSLASSIIKNLCENCRIEELENDGEKELLDDMFESAGMVFVQAMKELGRTRDILMEIKLLFGSVIAVPVQVFVTGVCLHMSEAPLSDAEEYLKEFLSKWVYKDEGYYFSTDAEMASGKGLGKQFSLGVNEYLEVVELYVMTCLGIVLRDIDSAISWVEKASLPEDKRQEFLRRLNSMSSSKTTSTSQACVSSLHANKHGVESAFLEEQITYNNTSKKLESGHPVTREDSVKETILQLSKQRAPWLWWFPNVTLKFGNNRLVLSNGKVILGCFLLFMCYFLRRKRASLKRVLSKQALSVKKALVDLWQLAFSYQVNPLAAVQPLPAATHGSR